MLNGRSVYVAVNDSVIVKSDSAVAGGETSSDPNNQPRTGQVDVTVYCGVKGPGTGMVTYVTVYGGLPRGQGGVGR